TLTALEEVCAQALAQLQGPPCLALLFFSPHHRPAANALATAAHERLGSACLLGCSGEAVVGHDREVEKGPALSLWLGSWPEAVSMTPFHLILEQTPDGYSLLGWPDELAQADARSSLILLLGDPFTFPTQLFLQEVNEQYPGLRV